MLTPQHVMKMTKALADPTRFRILQAIANAHERCCGELARDFPITQATVSQHLKVLTDAGLIEPRRACSGREGLNLAGESPVVPIARFRHVAIPQFVVGNHTFIAWCKRPGCPEDLEPLR